MPPKIALSVDMHSLRASVSSHLGGAEPVSPCLPMSPPPVLAVKVGSGSGDLNPFSFLSFVSLPPRTSWNRENTAL